MKDLNKNASKYKEILNEGIIQEAYASLVKFVIKLSTTLGKNLSDKYSVGNVFQGYMDYTYFYYSNDFLKNRKLKLGLVLNHERMNFEIWLLGQTIPVQNRYWEHFKSTKWNINRTTKPKYSILETTIIDKPNFNDLGLLAKEIENNICKVSDEIIEEILNSKLN